MFGIVCHYEQFFKPIAQVVSARVLDSSQLKTFIEWSLDTLVMIIGVFFFNLVALLVIAIFIGVILVFIKLNKKREGEVAEPSHQSFFIMGISTLGLGAVFAVIINPVFIGLAGLGVIYMIIGLKNRDKWNKPKNASEKSRS
jgi:hypothetical protein